MNAQHHGAEAPATTVLGEPGRFYEGEVPDPLRFVPLALVEESRLDRAK
jgi:hypothetical protein